MARPPNVDAITPFQRQEIRDALEQIGDDSELRVTIDYKHLDSQSFDTETGETTRTETTDSGIEVLRHEVTRHEVEREGGRLEIGDRLYRINQDDLSSPPATDDLIVESGLVYNVVEAETAEIGNLYIVLTRSV